MSAILPSDVFTGYEYVAAAGTVTANSIVIPLTALPELTEAEAAEADGDGAQLLRAIDKAIHDALTAMAVVDRPTNLTFRLTTETTSTSTRTAEYARRYFESAPAQVFDLAAEA